MQANVVAVFVAVQMLVIARPSATDSAATFSRRRLGVENVARRRVRNVEDVDSVRVTVDVSAPVQNVSERFLSFTLDSSALEHGGHGFNFSSTKARTLARGLQPAYLRLGGTLGDALVFNGSSPHKHDSNYTFLIGPDIWDAIAGFASAAGDVRLVFGLNALYRPRGGPWDPTNALSLLKYNREIGFRNIGFELGNEPNAYWSNIFKEYVKPKVLADDFLFLRDLLDADPFYGRGTELFGPDNTDPPYQPGNADYMKTVVEMCFNALSAVTFHHYNMDGHSATIHDCTNASQMDTFEEQVRITRRVMDDVAGRGKEILLGETSIEFKDRTPNVADKYVAGFMWLDKLGVSAKYGVQAVARQTFCAGLIDGNMDPNPDYWLSAVYKKLVGSRVLSVVTDQTDEHHNVRVYAHCTDRKAGYIVGTTFTLYAANLHENKTAELRPQLAGIPLGNVYQYLLEPYGGAGMMAKLVMLNGKLLRMIDEHTLPPLEGIKVQPPLRLPPRTFAFFVISSLNSTAVLPACR